ncbi:MAG: Antitoxin of toxin-antitoxin stability system [Candidatus Gottesmanbacteria bacterium GW2011_GWC2_42_8]|nr:MAG: Antitoxin of toxin-antitoxin stability system [Candidatus Gottesmanbacteria bacterium GW2011_GWC2_42_8]
MDLIQSTFIGAFELRKNLTSLLNKLQKKKEEIVVTQNGKPAAMLLSLDKYLEMKEVNEELEDALNELTNKEYVRTLQSEVELVKKGKGLKAGNLFKKLGL